MKLFANTKHMTVIDNNQVPSIGYTTKKYRFELDGSVTEQTVVCFYYDTNRSDFFTFESGVMVFHSFDADRPEYLKNVYFQSMKLQFSESEFIGFVKPSL